ncbi:MAG: hypothetical protein QG566_543 [Patescibacteria group bacterium]|nr:hypothetical protein [Patescibacteria group bacterium]
MFNNLFKSNKDKESLEGFFHLLSAIGGNSDTGNGVPSSDADDFSKGARFIPYEVTDARREGKQVTFVKQCGQCCWYWQMPDGTKIYHWERFEFENIAKANGKVASGDVGPCPKCGNVHTKGGMVNP